MKRLNLLDRHPASDDPPPVAEPASWPSPPQIAEALRTGVCPSDRSFDRFLPYEFEVVSAQHWTPLVVAVQAAAWLDELDIPSVVDIGSGAGKFCVATALAGRCRFTGLEQRGRLVGAARTLARLFAVDDRVRFIEGTLGELAVPEADAYYFYNPFGENLLGPGEHLDEEVELSVERYARDIAVVEDIMRRARLGTYMLTYNGFGGWVPASYEEVRVDRELPNVLRLWRKARA